MSAAPIAFGGFAARAASGDFWNTKQPSEWSGDEVAKLLNDSPWAKEFLLQLNNQAMLGHGGAYGRRNMGSGTTGPTGPNVQVKVLVRWESAKPVWEAKKLAAPKDAKDHYLVSLTGMPISGPDPTDSGNDEAEDRLKDQTTIERKGKEPIAPDSVTSTEGPGFPSIVFAFPRDYQPIEPSEKELTFILKVGKSMELKAKFNIHDMMYRGDLAL